MNAPIIPRQSRKVRLAIKQELICPYCGNESELVTGRTIYPHRRDLYDRLFYHCAPCEAHVGCHRASKKYGVETVPLGRLANAELRALKIKAHEAFDPLWMNSRQYRGIAYRWLADKMRIPLDDCHIGLFNEDQCKQVFMLCQSGQDTLLLHSRGANGPNAYR